VLNRVLYSMTAVGELSGFPIRVAKGFDPPDDLAPGMWVMMNRYEQDAQGETVTVPLRSDDVVDAFVLPPAPILPFIEQSNYLIGQIATVSRTPLPTMMGGDSQSGEALKQRETGLLSKIKKAQVVIGNAWEDAMALAAKVQNAYGGTSAPKVRRWVTMWRDAQIRNDGEIINNALAVRDVVGDEEVLNLIAQVFDYDEKKIKALMDIQRAGQMARFREMVEGLPGMNEGALRLVG
jgi:hypothetical protein